MYFKGLGVQKDHKRAFEFYHGRHMPQESLQRRLSWVTCTSKGWVCRRTTSEHSNSTTGGTCRRRVCSDVSVGLHVLQRAGCAEGPQASIRILPAGTCRRRGCSVVSGGLHVLRRAGCE